MGRAEWFGLQGANETRGIVKMPEATTNTAGHPEWKTIPAGTFLMGSHDFYPDEAPRHERSVGGFQVAAGPTTNAQFAAFIDATGYVTVAERALDAVDFPHLDEAERAPGSLVFTPTGGPVDLGDWQQWWAWVPGAQWRHPLGPGSDLTGKENHPVVQVSYADALRYAQWAGARLPTEAEHEYAAAGGGTPDPYVWGSQRDPDGAVMANTWHGRFPYLNTGSAGWAGTSPVGTFPANGYGLYDCIGNVWEWTADYYTSSHDATRAGQGAPVGGCSCGPQQDSRLAVQSAEPGSAAPRRVLKGGSHLCAPEYCLRYRPAARSPQTEDSATSHIGFRCARS